jgi:hypothetical protein
VAHFVHDRSGILADRVEHAGEGPAQRLRSEPRAAAAWSVLVPRTVSQPEARSTWRQRRSSSSPMRTPANPSTESIARRLMCLRLGGALRASSSAASSRARMCVAVSR